MRACKMTTHLTLEQPSEVVVSGNATVVYTVRGTAWAELRWLGGRMTSVNPGGGVAADSSFQFRTRYRTDITVLPGWQVGIQGTPRKFRVTAAADPDGRRRELVIMANEVALPERVAS